MSVLDTLVQNVMDAAGNVQEPWAIAEVTAVTPGGHDGFDVVTVRWRGTDQVAPHFASYTPALGHKVLMARFGPQLVILDRIVGNPPRTQ
jgi:hypothetical protein